jgi:putative salt-induced outer membrane protein YdiY
MIYKLQICLIPKISRLLFGIIALCSPIYAHAIVSMEGIELGKPPEGFVGTYELDLALQRGNTDTTSTATSAKLQWRHENITNFILVNYEYGKSAGITNMNKKFAHYRHIHQINTLIAWEGFAQFSSDEFRELTLRSLAGGGVRLTLGKVTDNRAIYLGLGMFYEHEELNTLYANEANTENTLRGNIYLVFKYQFNPHVSLVNSTYYQPELGKFSDFRAINDLTLISKLNKTLALKVGLDIDYDSKPPRDVLKSDTSLKVGMVLNF